MSERCTSGDRWARGVLKLIEAVGGAERLQKLTDAELADKVVKDTLGDLRASDPNMLLLSEVVRRLRGDDP